MNPDTIERVEKMMNQFNTLLSLAKSLFGVMVAVVSAIVGMAIWVNNTSNAVAATSDSLNRISVERQMELKEWGQWRNRKDEIDTRMVVLLENQQMMINRIQMQVDKKN